MSAPTDSSSDVDMQDATTGAADTPVAQPVLDQKRLIADRFEGREDVQKIRVLPGDTETAASFEITDEDHTLGNALRWVIMKNPDVEFCGYSIPHPSDPKMHLRIQTYDNVSVYEVFEQGLNQLMEVCDIITEKFEAAVEGNPKTDEST